jgi:hypothetical protein
MAIKPLLDTDSLLTAESEWMLARGLRMFLRSQILTDLSSEPDTTRSSRAKMADVTLSWNQLMRESVSVFIYPRLRTFTHIHVT